MTYELREAEQFGGQPIEAYRFSSDADQWLLTPNDRPLVLPAGTFTPDYVVGDEIQLNQEDLAGSLDVKLLIDHEIVQRLMSLTSVVMDVQQFGSHRGDESDARLHFSGRVSNTRLKGATAILSCVPMFAVVNRLIPTIDFQAQCNLRHYGPRCKANPAFFTTTALVTTVNGRFVTSADFASKPDGWFTAGVLRRANGDRRWIVDHVGNAIKLMTPFPVLDSLETVYASAGCDRRESTCKDKFTNFANFLGWPRIPSTNPFDVISGGRDNGGSHRGRTRRTIGV